MSKEQKVAKTAESALESGEISLNALREKHGLPTIKDGLAEQCLAKFDGVTCDRRIGFPHVFH